jgi:hypothetical protein
MSEINKANKKDELDELDELMTALENAGILCGWSKFMGRTDEITCKDCLLNRNCHCGYSAGNAACLTVRQQHLDETMMEFDAYQDEMDGIAEQCEMESSQ